MGCASFWKQSKSAESSSSSERWLLTVERDAAFALLTRRKDSREHAVELFDGKILAHITVGACVEGRMDLLFVVTNPGENNDRKRRIQLADKGDERDPSTFGILRSTIATSQSFSDSQAAVWKPSVKAQQVWPC